MRPRGEAQETFTSLVGKALLSLRFKGLVPTARQTVATGRELASIWGHNQALLWADQLESRLRAAGTQPTGGTAFTTTGRHPRLSVSTGRMVKDSVEESPKVVLFLVLGRDVERLAALVDHVAALESAARDFRPLFITDSTALHVFRRHEYVVEHLPAAHPRMREDPTSGFGWLPFVARRLRSIVDTYRPSTFIVYDDTTESGSPAGLALARLLSDLIPSGDER